MSRFNTAIRSTEKLGASVPKPGGIGWPANQIRPHNPKLAIFVADVIPKATGCADEAQAQKWNGNYSAVPRENQNRQIAKEEGHSWTGMV
jgi:hypothetical protein